MVFWAIWESYSVFFWYLPCIKEIHIQCYYISIWFSPVDLSFYYRGHSGKNLEGEKKYYFSSLIHLCHLWQKTTKVTTYFISTPFSQRRKTHRMSLWAKNKKQNLLPLSFHCLELSYINPYASKTGKYNLCSQRWEKRFWQVFVTLLWGFKILFLDLIFFFWIYLFLWMFVDLFACDLLCLWVSFSIYV